MTIKRHVNSFRSLLFGSFLLFHWRTVILLALLSIEHSIIWGKGRRAGSGERESGERERGVSIEYFNSQLIDENV